MADGDERPVLLEDYFERVEDFFESNFVSTAVMASVRYVATTVALNGCKVDFKPSVELPQAGAETTTKGSGKLGLGCEVDIPGLCEYTQQLVFHEGGLDTSLELTNLVDGLKVEGEGGVGGDSESASLQATYVAADYYAKAGVNRSSDGAAELNASAGALWGNVTAGVSVSRSLEDERNETMLVGVGFHHENVLTVGASVSRANSKWDKATVAATHKVGEDVSAAARYEIDLVDSDSDAVVTVGTSFPLGGSTLAPWKPQWSLMGSSEGTIATTLAFQLQHGLGVQLCSTWEDGQLLSQPQRWPKMGVVFSMEPQCNEESS